MERLTTRLLKGDGYYMKCSQTCLNDCQDICECEGFDRTINKLGEIEDILGDYDLDRLRALVEADRDGRCVLLPCKDWLELVFGEQEVFFAFDEDYEDQKIREITVRNEERFTWYDGWKTVMFNGTDENGLDYEFSPEDIGKTVFLTSEAAEAALKQNNE